MLAAGAIALASPANLLAQPAQGEETEGILVAASRAGVKQSQADYPGSVTVLSAADLERRQVRDIAEALRDVPGVAVSTVAGQTQLRLRGSEANHVLVLVDGIEVSDPFAGEFDMGTLQAEPGNALEVLRGPQSALYGSDAIGGVIAYRSASAREAPGLAARVEAGSFGTFNAALRAGFAADRHELALGATLVSSDGTPNARGGTRDIGRTSRSLSAKGALDLLPGLSLRGVARHVRSEGDFNDQDFDPLSPTFGLVVDSPRTRFVQDAFYGLLGAQAQSADGRRRHDFSVQLADIARDSFGPSGRSFGHAGERLKASHVSAFEFGSGVFAHSLTLAADWERERFRNTDPHGFAFTGTRGTRNIGLVGEYRASAAIFEFSAALRRDFNNRFADATSVRIAGAAGVGPSTRLRAAYGTGIKNPGFYELFGFADGRFIGNEDLRPEKSRGWEAGIDQQLGGDVMRLSATYFDSRLEDEIFTAFPPPDFIATPANRDSISHQQGIELALRAQLGPQVALDMAYSWLDAEENGANEVRRPAHIASAVLGWSARDGDASATLIVRHHGASEDLAFTDPSFVPVRVRLDDYTLVALAGEMRLDSRLRLFARVTNLLDERYEQVFSFVSQGRSGVVGIRVEL